MVIERSYKVGVTFWSDYDGIAQVICDELTGLGHQAIPWYLQREPTPEMEMLISFGPYGPFMQVVEKLRCVSPKPIFAHWNTEGVPDLRLPWPLVSKLSAMRSWIGRQHIHPNTVGRLFIRKPFSKIHSLMKRFNYVGDYHYTYRQGWLDIFADSSDIYAQRHALSGLPTVMVYWGGTRRWYDDLNLTRDVDVLWMGKTASNRRQNILDKLRHELARRQISFHCADGVQQPFIFGDDRTEFINRAKITLNVTRTWYDDTYLRFAIAAPNRSMIVSEPMLPHCPLFEPGKHYVEAPPDKLAEVIAYYLKNETERKKIVENAYQLITGPLNFKHSIARLVQAMETRL